MTDTVEYDFIDKNFKFDTPTSTLPSTKIIK